MSGNYRLTLILITVAVLILAAGCTQPAAQQQAAPSSAAVTMTVPFAPIPVRSPDGMNIAYELELKPADGKPFTVDKAEIIDPATGKVLFAPGPALLASLYHPASDPAPTAAKLRDGTGKNPVPRLSVWFTTSPDAVPDRLLHRITLNRSAAGLPAVTVTGGEVAVRKDVKPVVIGSPLKGPGWIAMETTSPTTHHFSAQITMDTITRVPQRYAQDWIYVDPATGQVAEGNASIAKNYYGFGKEIYAVAKGTVADMSDGLPDIPTIYSAPPATVSTAAGNYVIVDIGNNKYACYAHMVNGSVRVKKGDAVREGQVIGLMGNSGNSDLPHLHFQVVTDKASFLGAEGYPHVYRAFDQTGAVNETIGVAKSTQPGFTMDRLWSESKDFVVFFVNPVPRQDMLTQNWDIVTLP